MEQIKLRGRPVGSVSYAEVTLDDLINALGAGKAKVRVDKRWAEAVGVISLNPLPTSQAGSNTNSGEPKIQFNIE